MYHTVKHHLSYASTDCNVKISSQLFADSTIANKITCGKTKCEALVTGVLGPNSMNNLTQKLKDNKFFGVGFDASNKGNQKCCLLYTSIQLDESTDILSTQI